MPNTLAHLGVQTLATGSLLGLARLGSHRAPEARSTQRLAEALPWIGLGCVIPDLPWILQRAVRVVAPGVDAFDLRLYAVAQSTLLVSWVLCVALCLPSARPRWVGLLLGGNVLLHLVLDALQTKWANGVILAAPFDWRVWNAGWFWPESPVTWAMSAVGLAVLVGFALGPAPRAPLASGWSAGRWAIAGLLVLVYLAAPLALMPAAHAANAHEVQTLLDHAGRPGRAVEFDRAPIVAASQAGGAVRIGSLGGELLVCAGVCPSAGSVASLRGTFLSPEEVEVRDAHVHAAGWRDAASYVGLLGVAVVWGRALAARARAGGQASGR